MRWWGELASRGGGGRGQRPAQILDTAASGVSAVRPAGRRSGDVATADRSGGAGHGRAHFFTFGVASGALASLRAGATGTVVVVALSLLYLPTVAVWAVGYSAAVPVCLGTGTSVAPWVVMGEPTLPALPLFAAVPTGGSGWWLALALLPVAAGGYAAIVSDRSAPTSGWRRLGSRARLAGICALFALVFGQLTHISLGGRLSGMGPNPLLLSGSIAVLVFVGSCLADVGLRIRSRRVVAASGVSTPDRGLVGVDS